MGVFFLCRMVGFPFPRQPRWLMGLPRLLGDKQSYHLSMSKSQPTKTSPLL